MAAVAAQSQSADWYSAKWSSKRLRLCRARLDDARAQVAGAQAELASVDELIARKQKERDEIQQQLKVYQKELSTVEKEMSQCPEEVTQQIQESVPKARTLEVAVWRKRHEMMATNFCNIMLTIKREGATRFQDSMWRLWQAAEALHPAGKEDEVDPSTFAQYSCYHIMAELRPLTARKQVLAAGQAPYGAISQRWLLSFEAMARQIKDEHATLLEDGGPQALALKRLVATVAKVLDRPSLRALQQSKRGKIPPFGLSKITAECPEEIESFSGAWAILPLIWLPIALYVRSTNHLYEMLSRLHRMQAMSAQSSEGKQAEEDLRNVLDRDQRHYSCLVFAITGALQTLLMAKQELGRRFPYPLLGSSPPDPGKMQINGYPMDWADSWAAMQPIFRGIWIGDQVDEERAMFQYSFQSFSRQIEGAAQVLSFYASVEGSPTAKLAQKKEACAGNYCPTEVYERWMFCNPSAIHGWTTG
jgi:hypothetical protein